MADFQDDFDDLLFHVDVSIRYHSRRRRSFENIQQAALFVGFLFATQAVDQALTKIDSIWLPYVLGVVGAAFVGLTIVYRVGAKANDHNDLKRQFIRLQEDMELSRPDVTAQKIAQWRARRIAIEASEPPINRLVHALCYNELVRSKPSAKLPAKRFVQVQWYHWVFGWTTRAFDNTLKLGPSTTERY